MRSVVRRKPPGIEAPARRELTALTGLRGLAAAWVFAYHCLPLTQQLDPAATWALRWVGSAGYLGVDLFFVLSGFVIAYNYDAQHLHRSLRAYVRFLWKRLARIWPAHTAALLFFGCGLAIYSPAFDLSLGGFLRSLTMIQAWEFPGRQIWNPVAWSVSCEWAAYLLFPIIALATRRLSLTLALLAIPCVYLALYLAFLVGPFGQGAFSLGLQRVAASFTAGVLVFRIWSMRRVPIDTAGWIAIAALTLGTGALDMTFRRGLSMPEAAILACAVVYALACSTGALARSFDRLRYAGCISYSFYLVHWVPLTIAQTLLSTTDSMANAAWVWSAVLCSLLSAVALADFLYRFIEQPARRWMLSLTAARKSAIADSAAVHDAALAAATSAHARVE